MPSGKQEGQRGSAWKGRASPKRDRVGAPFRVFLGVTREAPEPQEVLPEHWRVTGGLWASIRAGYALEAGMVVKPGAGAGSGAGPTPGLRVGPVSVPQGAGVKAGLYAVRPCESAPPVGRTPHRPERDMGPLRVDVRL